MLYAICYTLYAMCYVLKMFENCVKIFIWIPRTAPRNTPRGSQQTPKMLPGGLEEALKEDEWSVLAALRPQRRPEAQMLRKHV